MSRRVCGRRESARLKVVFTHGCSICCIPGHVRYLTTARARRRAGGRLNSDRSVRENKGPPADHSGAGTGRILEALSVVDAAVIFDEPTPQAIIDRLRPDVLVKGADWAADAIVGRETVERRRQGRPSADRAGLVDIGIIEKAKATPDR
jgi:bifunctional ADP-heptose synthase (sugar kinase/adenylyltransferase)